MGKRDHTPFIYSAILAILMASFFSVPAQAATIEKIAIGAHEEFTRLVFHLNKATPHSLTKIGDDQTILFIEDIEASALDVSLGSIHKPITNLSYTHEKNGLTVRIETQQARRSNSFSLPSDTNGNFRIVIDIFGAAPAKKAIAKQVVAAPNPKRTKSNQKPRATGSLPPTAATSLCFDTQKALSKNAWDMRALIDHGHCHQKAGRLAQAQDIFERILTFDPDFHRARLSLAEIYTQQGDIARAQEVYEYVLLSQPPADVTKRIQDLMLDLKR